MSENNSAKTWEERSKVLNSYGIKYSDYLKSNHWKTLRSSLKKMKSFNKCKFCGSTKDIDLHHKHYRLLFCPASERYSLIALCRKCHHSVHSLSKELDISVHEATKRIKKSKRK